MSRNKPPTARIPDSSPVSASQAIGVSLARSPEGQLGVSESGGSGDSGDKPMGYVTRDGWSVSFATGHGIVGSKLQVFKLREKEGGSPERPGSKITVKFQHGDGDGRLFPNTAAAEAWAFEHGYLQKFYAGPWCRKCREQHRMNFGQRSKRTGFCAKNSEFVS